MSVATSGDQGRNGTTQFAIDSAERAQIVVGVPLGNPVADEAKRQ
jgi:hypothetical protein